jgi:hypothetical protein
MVLDGPGALRPGATRFHRLAATGSKFAGQAPIQSGRTARLETKARPRENAYDGRLGTERLSCFEVLRRGSLEIHHDTQHLAGAPRGMSLIITPPHEGTHRIYGPRAARPGASARLELKAAGKGSLKRLVTKCRSDI